MVYPGLFQPGFLHRSAEYHGTDTADELNTHHVTKVKPAFVPGIELKRGIENISFEIQRRVQQPGWFPKKIGIFFKKIGILFKKIGIFFKKIGILFGYVLDAKS